MTISEVAAWQNHLKSAVANTCDEKSSDTTEHATEACLAEAILDDLTTVLAVRAQWFSVCTEVVVGRNIADIVVAFARRRAPSSPSAPLSVSESVVLSALRDRGPTRIDLLERRCGVALGALREGRLSRLEDYGLIKRGRGGLVGLGSRWTSKYRVVAIEVKLTRWRDALAQALTYQRYADETFVALPESACGPATRSRVAFEDAGVGLLSIGERPRVVVPAQQQDAHDWRREFVLSRVVNS